MQIYTYHVLQVTIFHRKHIEIIFKQNPTGAVKLYNYLMYLYTHKSRQNKVIPLMYVLKSIYNKNERLTTC